MKKNNLIEMLQGCSMRNGMPVSASNPDGEPTVNRQSRLMSYRGYLRNLAMIFAVLVLSISNIGMVWGQTKVSTSNFYKLYADSQKKYSTLVSEASFPAYIGNTFAANMNGNLTSVPSISTPHNFAGLNTDTKYYRIKMQSAKTVTITNVANVKKVTFYGNGHSADRTITVKISKVSGSGSEFSVNSLSLVSSSDKIAAYSTEDFTSKLGYDANTYYTYTFTTNGDVSLWGIYVEAGEAASGCSSYEFHYQHGSDWNTTPICFSQVGSTTSYLTDEMPLPYAEWYNVTWSGSGAQTQTRGFTGTTNNVPMPFYHRRDKKFGANPQAGVLGGGLGRFHVYSDSKDENKYVSFVPTGYTLNFGTGDTWTHDSTLVFSPKTENWDEIEWYTPITTLTDAAIGRQIFVGLKTELGYVWCSPYSAKENISGLRTKTGSGDSWLRGGMSTSYAHKTGKFRIYANSGENNWYITFVPHYKLTYDANGGEGAPEAAYVSVEETPCQWTLSPTQPTRTDYEFLGWSTNSSASVPDADSKVIDLGKPYPAPGDVTLYAVWKACSGPNAGSSTWTAAGYTYDQNATANEMSLTGVTASNGGDLSYQWYKTTSDVANGEAISGATSNTYRPATDVAHADNWFYFCRVTEAGCSKTFTSPLSGAIVVNAASLTALECNTLYKVESMVASSITSITGAEQYAAGLSSNTKFEVLGTGTTNATGGPMGAKSDGATIDGTAFTNSLYFKGTGNKDGEIPTSRGIKFIVPNAGKLDIYVKGPGSINIVKEGGSGTAIGSGDSNAKVTVDVTAGTYYLYATASSRTLFGIQLNCCSTPAAPTAFAAGSITSTGATFTITDAGDAASYDIYYSTSSTAPDAGTAATTTSTKKTKAVTGLTASTTYYAWVRSVCDADHKSAWVALGTTSFTTAAAEPEALVHWTMNVATDGAWGTTATSTTDGTNISSISTSHDEGDNKGKSSATPKTAMADAEVTTAAEPTKSAKFTFTVKATKKVVPEKVTCEVFNVSAGNRTYKAQISDNNGHVYNSTNTVAVSTEATLTPATFTFANDLVLTGNVTVKIYAWKTSDSPTDFRMGQHVKLFGEVDNYNCTALNLTRGGQESGTYTVGNYTGNPLTCTVNAGEPASYQWKQYTQGQGVDKAVNAVGSGSTKTSFTPNPASANTYFYACEVTDICGNTSRTPYTGTFVFNAAATYTVTHSLTNVTATSGATGAGAATEGVAYDAVFAANSGYVLPSTITVTIGGSLATVGTGYTWNASTGAFQVPAAQVTGDIVVTIAGETAPAGDCITIAYFETTQHSNSDNKPDKADKYLYGYTNSAKTEAYAYTLTTGSTNNKGQGTGASDYLRMDYGTTVTVYADNTTTGGTPASFENVTGVSVDFKMRNSSYSTSFDIYVGDTKIADSVSLSGAAQTAFTTFAYEGLAQLSGTVRIINKGSGSSNYHFCVDNVQICTSNLTPCTTPTLPKLDDQELCVGADIAAWNATVDNASDISTADETVAYSWKKKGNDTELANTATFDLGSSATEAMAGTYVVTATVSAGGKASSMATKEVTLTVNEATEVTAITADKATVYPTNSVTLTATANITPDSWQWYTCTNAEGAGEAIISGATSANYTIASAPDAGTHYYKVKATGDCGTAERVYTLTVTAASECEKYFWFVYADDATTNGVVNNRDGFFTGAPTGSSNSSTYKFTLDGKEYEAHKNTGSGSFSMSFTIPEGSTATMGINCKGSSSKPLYLTHSSGTPQKLVSNSSSNGSFAVGDITEGTWTLTSAGSWTLAALGVQVCKTSTCTDATPTIAAANTTVCVGSELSISSTGYETGATFQWQKLNSSTSTWDDISGATNATYTVTAAAEHAGSYRLVATKECARTSNTVTIAVPSAPVFNSFTATRTVMATQALSITDVEASDATSYAWYKSADANYDAGTDTKVGTAKELLLASGGEAAGDTYYLFCVASNACGSTTSGAITVNVIALIEEDCATKDNEGAADFGFVNTKCSEETYSETACWKSGGRAYYLTYSAPTGKYLKEAKVTVASTKDSKCGYAYSTDNGTNWTYAELTDLSTTLTEKTINFSGKNVTDFRIGRNLQDGSSKDWGSTSGTFYLSKICFEYSNACTATTVTPSTSSVNYTMGGDWTNPKFTLSVAGTLTYSSSNEEIASVDESGNVTFNDKAGTVTITASYAGGTISETEYCESSGSYTINVSCPGGAPKIVAADGTNMSGCNSSVTLNAKTQNDTDFADGTYQWFRDGVEIEGATSSSYTAIQTGVYTVEYTSAGDCTSPSTNHATVTSDNVELEVERLVPFQYYHVNKTYSDQMKDRHLFSVTGSAENGSTGRNFKLTMSRNGEAATDMTTAASIFVKKSGDGQVDTVMIDLNKLSGKYSEGDELVLTCAAVDCKGNVSAVYKDEITIHVIGATPTLALICSGSSKAGGTRKKSELTVGGDFLTGYNVADLCQQTGPESFEANAEWGLYTDLKANYIVTPVNGYAVFNKLNYEPFDILLLTDYPKADKSDAAATVLDDMAALCDYRPMLSFKTHMVKKSPSKWAAKGFTTSPVVTKEAGRLNLNIVCYAHPMFASLKTGENVYTDVGNTSAPLVYTMLTGVGHEGEKGMQGFELAAAENFITIGLTHYNATITKDSPNRGEVAWTPGPEDRMLVTVAERQANPVARFILFSLNCGAQSKLTEKGEDVVLACLNYLLGTAEGTIEPADCSFTFDNGEGNKREPAEQEINCPSCPAAGDGKWSNPANWGPDYRLLPGEFTAVRIQKPVEVDITNAHVMEARILEDGSITIPAGKALEVKSTIRRMDGSEIYPTDVNDIVIGSSAEGNGTLIFNNDEGDTKARVLMYSTAKADMETMSAATSTWQYIGTPHTDVANARSNYYGSWLYQYDTASESWVVIPNGGPLQTFRGYCVTHPSAPVVFDMSGTLAATTSAEIDVPANKYVVTANSWVAPIDINKITDDDMEGITDKTIYFFNTGSDPNQSGSVTVKPTGDERWAAGTYVSVPIHAASYTGTDDHIPSMQGFYVVGGTSNGTLHLDYDRHVRGQGRGTIVSGRMHAPKRVQTGDNEPEVLKIIARGSRYDDRLIVLEREDFTRRYDSGWDGEAWGGSELSPMVYITNEAGVDEAVSAIPEYEGTVITFRAGEDSEYRFEFIYSEDAEPLYLFDTENNTYTQIMTGNAYYFTTSDKAPHSRFILTRKAPQITTGTELTSDGESAKARKLLIEDKMYILLNGMLYDATGKVVK